MPLTWMLSFKRSQGSDPERDIPCSWISDNWISIHSASKKTVQAFGTQAKRAEAALNAEISARQELFKIHKLGRLSALCHGEDLEPLALHDLFLWLNLQQPVTLSVELIKFTNDPSDGKVITDADFKDSFPISFRPIGDTAYVFNFKLGAKMNMEDFE